MLPINSSPNTLENLKKKLLIIKNKKWWYIQTFIVQNNSSEFNKLHKNHLISVL